MRIARVTAEVQDAVARSLEEAAMRVRQVRPTAVEIDVEDDVDMIDIGWGLRSEHVAGLRTPKLRRIEVRW